MADVTSEPQPNLDSAGEAAIIAVPDDLVDELVEAGLVDEMPTLRGPLIDAIVMVGVDSAALVTLLQAPDSIRAFASWLVERVRPKNDRITLTGGRGDRRVHLTVDGDVPIKVISDFLASAFEEDAPDMPPS